MWLDDDELAPNGGSGVFGFLQQAVRDVELANIPQDTAISVIEAITGPPRTWMTASMNWQKQPVLMPTYWQMPRR